MSQTSPSAFSAGVTIALRTQPEFESWLIWLVRVIALPAFTSVFYLAMSTASGNPTSGGLGNSLAAAVSVGAVATSVAATSLIAQDRFQGTLPYLVTARSGRFATWAGRFSVLAVTGLISSGVAGAGAVLLSGSRPEFSQLGGIVALLVLTIFGSLGVGLVLGGLALRMRDSLALANLAELVLPIATGAVAPIAVFPEPLRSAVFVFPQSHLTDAARELGSGGFTGWFAFDSAAAIAVGAIWLAAGIALWRSIETQTRKLDNVDSLGI